MIHTFPKNRCSALARDPDKFAYLLTGSSGKSMGAKSCSAKSVSPLAADTAESPHRPLAKKVGEGGWGEGEEAQAFLDRFGNIIYLTDNPLEPGGTGPMVLERCPHMSNRSGTALPCHDRPAHTARSPLRPRTACPTIINAHVFIRRSFFRTKYSDGKWPRHESPDTIQRNR
jgi:hypothetical protein